MGLSCPSLIMMCTASISRRLAESWLSLAFTRASDLREVGRNNEEKARPPSHFGRAFRTLDVYICNNLQDCRG